MKRIVPLIIVLSISLIAAFPLFSSGYFPMHDDTQVGRVIAMGRSLSEGQFPVRMVADLGFGYGYPIYNFYGPLPYYFGGTLFAFGVPALLATKIMFAVGILIPAVAMYAVVSRLLGVPAAVIAAILYMYAPYHAVQIYVRGAVGEYWILMFWPLILYAFTQNTNPRFTYRRQLLGAAGVAGAVLTHTLLGYVTVLFLGAGLLLYWFICLIRRTFDLPAFVSHLFTVLLGLGLSAFFWLPALTEMGYTSVAGQVSETANYRDHFVCFSQLWTSVWGYGGSAPGCLDGMSFILGKLHVMIAFLSVLAWLWCKPKGKNIVFIAGTLITIASIFLATPLSGFIWQVLPGFAYLQYPWRFLALSAFGTALLGAVLITLVRTRKAQSICLVVLAMSVIVLNGKWFVPQYTYEIPSSAFEKPSDLRWRVSRISHEYLPNGFVLPDNESGIVFDTISGWDGLTVTKLQESAVEAGFMLQAAASMDITVRKAYFPGWRYYVNNVEVTVRITNGLPVIHVDAGQSLVSMRFTDTPVRTIGNIISFFSLILVTVILYERQRNAKR